MLLCFCFFACQETKKEAPAPAPKPATFVEKVETAHKKADFLAKNALQFDIVLTFGGSERLNGTMTLLTNSSAGLIEKSNGEKIYFNKDKVFHSPTIKNSKSARFAAYTWSYFTLFPYKLSDPGTQWAAYPNSTLNGTEYNAEKLTFTAGTGDAPDDWYIAYADKASNLLEVGAYIVTAGGKEQEKAEEDPHAIKYEKYENVDGVPVANHWTFWGWRTDAGLTEQLGEATLSNIKFVEVADGFFDMPEGFVVAQ